MKRSVLTLGRAHFFSEIVKAVLFLKECMERARLDFRRLPGPVFNPSGG